MYLHIMYQHDSMHSLLQVEFFNNGNTYTTKIDSTKQREKEREKMRRGDNFLVKNARRKRCVKFENDECFVILNLQSTHRNNHNKNLILFNQSRTYIPHSLLSFHQIQAQSVAVHISL